MMMILMVVMMLRKQQEVHERGGTSCCFGHSTIDPTAPLPVHFGLSGHPAFRTLIFSHCFFRTSEGTPDDG
jgi:hypothetical protein